MNSQQCHSQIVLKDLSVLIQDSSPSAVVQETFARYPKLKKVKHVEVLMNSQQCHSQIVLKDLSVLTKDSTQLVVAQEMCV